jgi:hypothetical protein
MVPETTKAEEWDQRSAGDEDGSTTTVSTGALFPADRTRQQHQSDAEKEKPGGLRQ